MNDPSKTNRIYFALCVNAVLLVVILLALVSRDGRLLAEVPALAQQAASAPVANPGHGLSVMPGQLASQVWGCYVIDNDNQTLSVYAYLPGDHELRLAAARDVQYDRRLGNFNTAPSPSEIKEMIDRAAELPRAVPPAPASPETRP